MLLKRFLAVMMCMAVSASPAVAAEEASGTTDATPLLTVQELSRPNGSVPLGAQRVALLTLRATASCAADVRIASLTLEHRGLGSPQDIAGVYVFQNGARRSRSAVPSGKKGIATLHLRGITVPACKTMSIDILGDISSNAAASGEHAFSLVWSGNVVTDPVVPVTLNLAGEAASRTIPVGPSIGSVTAESLSLPNTLSYGSARTVARLRLTARGSDQLITAITFVNDGSARDAELQNLFLETSGHSRLSPTTASLDGDRVRIELQPPLLVKRNEVRLVQLLGDIRASRRKTVRLIIQQASDIEADEGR
ncbi:MAG: hypothetical protein HOO67_00265 [Candidatus Peribacteraceae bacterium]|nr:hypothetical protein [Candidatus Peribacteraceae bacterium]